MGDLRVEIGDMACEVERLASLATTIRYAVEEGGCDGSAAAAAVQILSDKLYEISERMEGLSCQK